MAVETTCICCGGASYATDAIPEDGESEFVCEVCGLEFCEEIDLIDSLEEELW